MAASTVTETQIQFPYRAGSDAELERPRPNRQKSSTKDVESRKVSRVMNSMNFELAHKQLALHGHGSSRRARHPSKPVHRPSVALIMLATTVQIIAMAAVLGTLASAL